jgi:hypothetical protein
VVAERPTEGRQLWGAPDPQLGESASREVAIELTGDLALEDPELTRFHENRKTTERELLLISKDVVLSTSGWR